MLKRSLRLNTEEVFSSLSIRGSNAIEALLEHARAPAESKQLPSIGISNAAELIGYTSHYIRHLERCGDIPEPQKNEDGRRVYTLADINNIRDKLGKSLKRPTKNTMVVAFANLKGGSAKTTTSVHFAQFSARLGLKVLLIDLDQQASATSMFGYLPDIHIKETETIVLSNLAMQFLVFSFCAFVSIERPPVWLGFSDMNEQEMYQPLIWIHGFLLGRFILF